LAFHSEKFNQLLPQDPLPPLASAMYHIGNLDGEVVAIDFAQQRGSSTLTATNPSSAVPRPNPYSLVSKMKLYFFSCKGNTEIIPLMLMKYQLTQ